MLKRGRTFSSFFKKSICRNEEGTPQTCPVFYRKRGGKAMEFANFGTPEKRVSF